MAWRECPACRKGADLDTGDPCPHCGAEVEEARALRDSSPAERWGSGPTHTWEDDTAALSGFRALQKKRRRSQAPPDTGASMFLVVMLILLGLTVSLWIWVT